MQPLGDPPVAPTSITQNCPRSEFVHRIQALFIIWWIHQRFCTRQQLRSTVHLTHVWACLSWFCRALKCLLKLMHILKLIPLELSMKSMYLTLNICLNALLNEDHKAYSSDHLNQYPIISCVSVHWMNAGDRWRKSSRYISVLLVWTPLYSKLLQSEIFFSRHF